MEKKIIITFLIICNLFSIFAQEFTIAVIPDTQSYVDINTNHDTDSKYLFNHDKLFFNQMEFISKNSISNGGNIAFAIHVGDLVNHQGDYLIEWEKAYKGISILNNQLPFLLVPGNHDYDRIFAPSPSVKKGRIDGGSVFNEYFGPENELFNDKVWYRDSFNNGMNSCVFYNIEGIDFLFLGLELEPSDAALEWAQSIIDNYKYIPTILVTHEYIGLDFDKDNIENAAFLNHSYRKGFNRNTPSEIWNKFVKKNNQIFMVLCGHHFRGDFGENFRIDKNEYGYEVYSLLQDFQGRKSYFESLGYEGKKLNCGDGWLRLLKFDLKKNEIHVMTYSTAYDKYENDDNSDFIIKINWNWNDRFLRN